MKPVEPPSHDGAHLVTFAKEQPPYHPLPASVDDQGTVMTQWELTAEEMHQVLMGGQVRLWLHGTDVNNGRPMIPIKLEIVEPMRQAAGG